MIDLIELENNFLNCNARRETARLDLFNAAENTISAAQKLEGAKAITLLSRRIDGKNETERKSQLSSAVLGEADELQFCEAAERKARYDFEFACAEYDLCRHRLHIADIATHQ